ncbi:recombinase family protein [Marinobacterium rhizophilum]|uniref:Recombinase family protein n=1 Tax=Marinobacterium rhizophilum TaxID=420402 RepID=A0ABY5HNL6_9GAMM|nr:recombinase family protein [Marinobacterium rhizophilum]UTW13372.1 recombinase family protein [Marinobacterium rhizophilum]
MFIRAYLRASTEDQNAARARDQLTRFAEEHGQRIASYYIENVSGASLARPELHRLLSDAQPGDILLLEQVDRLTRLKDSDWQQLKRLIEDRQLSVVAMDLPTSYAAMSVQSGIDDFMKAMLKAINTMMLDMLAAIARKDFEDRRRRQAQGIEQAKQGGKYKGRKADTKKHLKVIELRDKGCSLNEVAELTGYSKATVCRILAQVKEAESATG